MKNVFILAIGLFLISCAHHPDVRPGDGGIHNVIVTTDDKEEGARSAINQANSFCDESKKVAAFVNEEQKYTGDMEEKNYQNAKRASKVAKVVGSTVHVFGASNESNLGGIVGLGGVAADSALGKGYTVTMKFKCVAR
ncbi:MAG: hypothetical protein EOP06_13995 [Proteobacteria bacterium]|nr:MAG: hypothetical protein EOP06_13995 [Pseudomonadota bacterium]